MSSENCRRCGRPLFTEKSIRRGMGPVCWNKSKGKGLFPEVAEAGHYSENSKEAEE